MNKKVFIQKKSERGQSFMELAISMIFLVMLLSATVDLGWAFYTMTALRDAAQESASYGAMCTNVDKVRQRFFQSATAPVDMRQVQDVTVCFSNPLSPNTCKVSNIERGDNVKVTISYLHRIVTPLVGSFINRQDYPLMVEISDTVLQPNTNIVSSCRP